MDSDTGAKAAAPGRGERLRVELIGLKDDHDAFDRDYFAALSPAERMAMIPAMFAEQWRLKGGDAELLRLRRDVARLQRRER